jgi:sulfatase modifying factor 1
LVGGTTESRGALAVEVKHTDERVAGDATTSGPAGMKWIPGGMTLMGSDDFYPEEQSVHRVAVDGFWMDAHPVTAAEFRRFVRETGYVTVAERPLDPDQYPDADPDLLAPGSLVFQKTAGPVRLDDYRNWWEFRPGAYWKRPGGAGTTTNGRDLHPVVHVAYEDVEAYASGPARTSPRRPSGSLRHAVVSRVPCSPGATSTFPTVRQWRTPGRASSPGRI